MSLAELMAGSLRLSESYLVGVAGTASHRYKEYWIKKADGKSYRRIEQPSKELKLLQRWLVRHVFDLLPTHPCAHAYVRGKSIVTNAAVHRKGRYISRLDLESFFPSLTSVDIQTLLERSQLLVEGINLDEHDIRFVTSLTCRFGRLTIGAPSSPTVSNKLIYDLDLQVARISEGYAVNYSRYADDLYFSSTESGVLFEVCSRVEKTIAATKSPRLTINVKKTYHASRKKRMAVTGLRITPEAKISIGRDLKRKIRAFAHRAQNKTIGEADLGWLEGMLAYASSIEPDYVGKIRSAYNLD